MNIDTGMIYRTAEEINAARERDERVVDISEDLAMALGKLEAEAGRSLPVVVKEVRGAKPYYRWFE